MRKVYATKTFISASDSCPYCVGFYCEIRNINVYENSKSFYLEVCCTSRYTNRCSYFEYRISPIKPNKYFHASCCCPYMVQDVCEIRRVNVRHKNKVFHDRVCTKSDYIEKCPHFMERTCKIKIKPDSFTFKKCPVIETDHCKVRGFCIKERCHDFYNHTCRQPNYSRCCPHYMESL